MHVNETKHWREQGEKKGYERRIDLISLDFLSKCVSVVFVVCVAI